jgi:hypothetical protein
LAGKQACELFSAPPPNWFRGFPAKSSLPCAYVVAAQGFKPVFPGNHNFLNIFQKIC